MFCKSPVNGVVGWNCVMLFLHKTTLHLATRMGYNEVEMFLTRSIMTTDH